MKKQNDFGLDVRAARKKAGLTQADCAHLMGCDATKLTRLENGNMLPSLRDLSMLGLIFGRTFESLIVFLLTECRESLAATLETLPSDANGHGEHPNRQLTLNRIAADLADYARREYGKY